MWGGTHARDKPREKKPKLEDTDASSYFGSSNKIKRTAVPVKKPAPPAAQATKKKVDDDEDEFIVDDFEFDEELMQEVESTGPVAMPTTTNGTKKGNNTKTEKAATSPLVIAEKPKTPVKRKAPVKEEDSSEGDFIDDPKPKSKTDSSKRTPKKVSASQPPAAVKKETCRKVHTKDN